MSWTYKALRATKPAPFAAPTPGSKEKKPTLLPIKPEDWPRLFEQNFNVGDLDAVMALYETHARFGNGSGKTLVGCDAIRKVLGAMIEPKTQLITTSSCFRLLASRSFSGRHRFPRRTTRLLQTSHRQVPFGMSLNLPPITGSNSAD